MRNDPTCGTKICSAAEYRQQISLRKATTSGWREIPKEMPPPASPAGPHLGGAATSVPFSPCQWLIAPLAANERAEQGQRGSVLQLGDVWLSQCQHLPLPQGRAGTGSTSCSPQPRPLRGRAGGEAAEELRLPITRLAGQVSDRRLLSLQHSLSPGAQGCVSPSLPPCSLPWLQSLTGEGRLTCMCARLMGRRRERRGALWGCSQPRRLGDTRWGSSRWCPRGCATGGAPAGMGQVPTGSAGC